MIPVNTDPTTWLVAATGPGGTEYSDYGNGNGKASHRAASDLSRRADVDHATVTFGTCVTTYRNGIGTGPTT